MFRKTRTLMSRAAMALLATAVLAACDDATGSDDDDHREPAGMVITDQNDATLVSVSATRQVTGTLTVPAGQDRHIRIYFLDEDGVRFQLDDDDDDDDHTLAWAVANATVAAIAAHDGHHDLEGKAAGSTTVVFSVMHEGHSDYDSPAIPITVTP